MRILLLALLLSACSTAPKVETKVQTVEVKVIEPCIQSPPAKPAYRFGKGPRPTDKEMAAILASDFEAADRYGRAWEASAAGCLISP